MNVKQRRRGSKRDSLVLVEQVGDVPFNHIRSMGVGQSAELGTLQVQVPVRHPRRDTSAEPAGLRGRGLGRKAKLLAFRCVEALQVMRRPGGCVEGAMKET